jgi:hypothetical protein
MEDRTKAEDEIKKAEQREALKSRNALSVSRGTEGSNPPPPAESAANLTSVSFAHPEGSRPFTPLFTAANKSSGTHDRILVRGEAGEGSSGTRRSVRSTTRSFSAAALAIGTFCRRRADRARISLPGEPPGPIVTAITRPQAWESGGCRFVRQVWLD